MQNTLRTGGQPRIDPNEHARKMAEAKNRAAEIRERRKTDGYQAPPAFVARPVPATTYPVAQQGGQYDAQQPQGMTSAQQVAVQLQRPQFQDVGPYGQSSYSSQPAASKPAYRGMVQYGEYANAATSDGYGAPQPSFPAGYSNPSQPAYNSGTGSHLPAAVGGMSSREAAATAKEAEDTFHSMLRSDNGPKGKGRRPQWSSEYSSPEVAEMSAPGNMSSGSLSANSAPTGPLSTKHKLAMMRDDLTGPTSASDPRVSKEYSGIVKQQFPGRGGPAVGPSGDSSYGSAPSRSGGMGGGMGGGGDSFADAFPTRTGATGSVVSRTGLKPSGRKPPVTAAPAPSTYGNDDMPVGRSGTGAAPPAPAPALYSYGNDDMPVGRSAGAAGPAMKDLGPDSLPPGANAGTSPPPGAHSVAASRARARLAAASSFAEPEHNWSVDQNTPPGYGAQGYGGGARGSVRSGTGGAHTPAGAAGGALSLLKAKMRTSSARSSRSANSIGSGGMGREYDEEGVLDENYVSDRPAPPLRMPAQPARNVVQSAYRGYDDGDVASPPAPAAAQKRPAVVSGAGARRTAAPPVQNVHAQQNDEDEEERPSGTLGSAGGGGSAPPSEQADPNIVLLECSLCGRKMNERALGTHERVCQKVFQTKRKAFDTKAMIIPDEAKALAAEAGRSAGRKGGKSKAAGKPAAAAAAAVDPDAPTNKTAWESKSSALREAMAAARNYKAAIASGINPRDVPMPTMTADPSLVPCPHCGRTFNEHAAERHIPKCATTRAKPTVLRSGAGVAAGASGVKRMKATAAASGYEVEAMGGMEAGYGSGAMPATMGGRPPASGRPQGWGGDGSARAGGGYGDLPDLPDVPRSALGGGGYARAGGGGRGMPVGGGVGRASLGGMGGTGRPGMVSRGGYR